MNVFQFICKIFGCSELSVQLISLQPFFRKRGEEIGHILQQKHADSIYSTHKTLIWGLAGHNYRPPPNKVQYSNFNSINS